MSQESSSTQLCEVLIDCYRDKESKRLGETNHSHARGRYGNDESDEDPLHKGLDAPFTLLRRPASKTNEASFQFGKAKKASFDFTGRGKGVKGVVSGSTGDDGRVGKNDARDVEASRSENLPLAGFTRMKEPTLSSPKGSCDDGEGDLLKRSSLEIKRASPDDESACSRMHGSFNEASAAYDNLKTGQLLSQRAANNTKGGKQITFRDNDDDNDDDVASMNVLLDNLEKSVYFQSSSKNKGHMSEVTIDEPSRPQKALSPKLSTPNSVQEAEKHQDVPETEAEVEDLKSGLEKPNDPADTSTSLRYPKFNLFANRLKKSNKLLRDQKDQKASNAYSDRVHASERPVRVAKSKSRNMKNRLQVKNYKHSNNTSPMSGLHEAISSVIKEAYAEELNAFTIEREHFTAQIAALKAINCDLSSDLHKANSLNQQSSKGLRRIRENVTARNLQIEELKNFADAMKSDLMRNKAAVKEMNDLYGDTKKDLTTALSAQECFSQMSKKNLNSVAELKESAEQLLAVRMKNEHLYDQIGEKDTLLAEEKKCRAELDQRLQQAFSQVSNVNGINTQIMTISQRLEDLHGGMMNTHCKSNAESGLSTCLQAIKYLEEQQKLQSGYIMTAGAELQSLSRIIPAELQKLETLFQHSPWDVNSVGRLEEDMSELKAKMISLMSGNEQVIALNEAKYSLQQKCSEKEVQIANLQAIIELQNTKVQSTHDKVQSLQTEITRNKQLIEQDDLKTSRLKEVEASNVSLQHDLKAAVEEQTRLAISIRDRHFAEADQRSELERLQTDRKLLEENITEINREKSLLEAKMKESFKREREEYEAGLQRLIAEKVLALENKLSDNKHNTDKLQLALDSTCKELVALKSKNEELSITIHSREETIQELIADLRIKASASDDAAAKLCHSAEEVREKNRAIDRLSNSKEKAEAEAQILGEELQALKKRLLHDQNVTQERASELAKLKQANDSLNMLAGKKKDALAEGSKIQEFREGVDLSQGQDKSQILREGSWRNNQDSEDCFHNLASKENAGYATQQRGPGGQTFTRVEEFANLAENKLGQCGASYNPADNGVPASGQWPGHNNGQSALLFANKIECTNSPRLANSEQAKVKASKNDEICPYFQSSDFSSGILGTPSLFSLYTNKEHFPIVLSSQKPDNNENSGDAEAGVEVTETMEQTKADLDLQTDVRTFSDFRKMENSCPAPSSISDLSDLDITTPEDIPTKPDSSAMNPQIQTEINQRPRSSNMSARRVPSRSSPSQKDSDVSSEHVRNVGPEDIFQLDRKRPNPNTASKIKPSIFKGRGESRVLFQNGCHARDDNFDNCGTKKRRIDRPPFLRSHLADKDSSSMPILDAGTSKAEQGKISKSKPQIKKILNWASMYANTQQEQRNFEIGTARTPTLEQKMMINKRRLTESGIKDSSSSNRRQAPTLPKPKTKPPMERRRSGKVLVEKSVTPQDAKGPHSLARFERLQNSCSTRVSATPGKVDGSVSTAAASGRTKRRRVSRNNRYSFRFSQETSAM